MEEVKKRGKGRIKGCLAIRNMYKFYKTVYEKDAVDYKTYSKIVKKCNKEMIRLIVEESECIKLPYRLGHMQISKFKRSFNQPQNKWQVDYKRSKELGFKVYHDSPYIYKWVWKKHQALVRNKTGYKFKAGRTTTRMVAPAVRNKIDYFR